VIQSSGNDRERLDEPSQSRLRDELLLGTVKIDERLMVLDDCRRIDLGMGEGGV
jgi:hypothetical protein